MAVLNQQDRIELSKKIAGIEQEIASAEELSQRTDEAKIDAFNKDEPNRKLLQEKTDFINLYQEELRFLDGITRSELTESIMEDSVNRVKNNSFFPNDPQTALPSISDGVWKNLNPFYGNHAIGKNNFEQYPSTGFRTEGDIISDINAKIVEIEARPIPNRATGKMCVEGGSCSGETPPGSGVDETTCLANGGVWTPGPDYYVDDTVTKTLLDELKLLVQEWKDRLDSELSTIPTNDPNSTRDSGNTSAINDINNAIAVIDVWQAVQDYDTSTSLPSDCATYDAMVEGDFQQAKMQQTTLDNLKAELSARPTFISSRISALSGNDYLGSVGQDLNTGTITSTEGLYGERMLFIDMRINAISGTLSKKIGLEKVGSTQDKIKESAETSQQALSSVMVATKAVAPGLNTRYLNVQDASQFSASDRIYVVADNQQELSGSIISKDGNRVELSFDIPKKYTRANQTRLYKLL